MKRLTAALTLACSTAAVAQEVVRAPRPATPYIVPACPFECCVYGTWRFLTAADVRSAARVSAPLIGKIESDQRVRANRGHVRMDTLGLVLVRRDLRDANTGNVYRAGDTLLVLDYVGEGYSHVWVRGERRLLDLSYVMSQHGPPVGGDTAAMVELRAPARQWWAHVTLPIPVAKDSRPATRAGWVHMTSDVDVRGADACGADSAATSPAAQQPPASAQNPSPMSESTRAHERLTQRELAGARLSFAGPGGQSVDAFIPERTRAHDSVDVVIHFHGAAWLPHQAVDQLGGSMISAVLNLGSGSGVYHRTFGDPAVFDSLIAGIARQVSQANGRRTRLGSITLAGFSAGHGAIRAILRDPGHVQRIGAVLLLDGMHTSYVPDGKVLAAGGSLDTTNLTAFATFARAAMRGEKRFLVTHSEIFPGTFASTTETADWLLQALGLRRAPVLQWGPRGMQQLSESRSGRFELLGFAGNSAPDHVDQLHAMPELLARLLAGP